MDTTDHDRARLARARTALAASLDTDKLLAVLRRDKRLEEPAKGLPVEYALEELRRRQAIRDTAPAAAPTDQALAEADGTIAPALEPGDGADEAGGTVSLEPVEQAPASQPSVLETAGFMQHRGAIMAAAGTLEGYSTELIDVLIEFAEGARRRARLADAPRQQLDAVDLDVEVLRAVRSFRKRIEELGQRASARSRIAGPLDVQR